MNIDTALLVINAYHAAGERFEACVTTSTQEPTSIWTALLSEHRRARVKATPKNARATTHTVAVAAPQSRLHLVGSTDRQELRPRPRRTISGWLSPGVRTPFDTTRRARTTARSRRNKLPARPAYKIITGRHRQRLRARVAGGPRRRQQAPRADRGNYALYTRLAPSSRCLRIDGERARRPDFF